MLQKQQKTCVSHDKDLAKMEFYLSMFGKDIFFALCSLSDDSPRMRRTGTRMWSSIFYEAQRGKNVTLKCFHGNEKEKKAWNKWLIL